ncbi:uridine 5'-monophosphate synthase-like isoform X2 [Dreissena polymorpha]|uniref:uridine 5'-monophosphate synthase-like isoform X2 n=1 Tax=Dreissena polymorpha TaxID=45954 RepID=UPI002264087E|nr:uridine 5'-monophosphate synthase-like isoform X2 [Dreissena polymorpha]
MQNVTTRTKKVSLLLHDAACGLPYHFVCGVPYTALPLATVISVECNKPMLIRRREAKDYGTKKMIEGKFSPGDTCLVVEDVVTSGSSVWETVQLLQEYGLKVTDAVVLLDREQGAGERLKQKGVNLHSVLTMTKLVDVLRQNNKIDEDMHQKVLQFVSDNQFSVEIEEPPMKTRKLAWSMSFKERSEHEQCKNSVAKELFAIMENKRSNLVLSADLTNADEILKLVDSIGPSICMVKTHVDIIEDFSRDFVNKLVKMAQKHNFLIFEDRKFADIGSTVQHQFSGGVFKIADWAHVINAHSVPGPGVIQGLKKGNKQSACLLIAEMSSAGNLAKGDYVKETLKIAQDHPDFVIGFISQSNVCEDDPQLICMTPGVKLEKGGDSLGQQYVTPYEAVYANHTDLIIVGRGIIEASDPVVMAEEYREAAFQAYEHRIALTL